MQQYTYFAQAGNYNCQTAADSSYGAGAYGTCVTGTDGAATGTTQQAGYPGAPNTGDFFGFVTSGSFSILLPLAVAIVLVAVATIFVARKKANKQ